MNLEHDALAGLLVGVLIGLTGVGGGSLMAPILIYLFHFKAKVAVGSDLTYAAVAKVFGSWQHYHHGSVNVRLALQMAIGSVPSSLLGIWLLHKVDQRSSADGRVADHTSARVRADPRGADADRALRPGDQ